MGTVHVERCPECLGLIGAGTLYEHQQRHHKPVVCVGLVHRWPDDAAEGDTCNCGDWYRFSDRIQRSVRDGE